MSQHNARNGVATTQAVRTGSVFTVSASREASVPAAVSAGKLTKFSDFAAMDEAIRHAEPCGSDERGIVQ